LRQISHHLNIPNSLKNPLSPSKQEEKQRKIKTKMEKVYPSEMRLLLVTRQIKRAGNIVNGGREGRKREEGKIIIIAVKMWKAKHKEEGGKNARSFAVLKRKKTLCQRGRLLRFFLLTTSGEWDKFYDYYTDIIMLFPRLV
jgi:hypothetical protein